MAKGLLLTNPSAPDLFGGATTGQGGMDVAIDASGHITTLIGRERVRHDILKGVLTGRKGTYGTTIPSFIGEKRIDGAIGDLMSASVQTFINDYRDTQDVGLPDEEIIQSIRGLEIFEDPGDRTKFVVSISLNMADGQTIEIEHRF